MEVALSTLDAVRTGLREAASLPSGTSAPVFASYSIEVAGKTGTAQVYDASVHNNVNYAWYASYAPFNDPKYVVVVMIEKGGHGGTAAASFSFSSCKRITLILELNLKFNFSLISSGMIRVFLLVNFV